MRKLVPVGRSKARAHRALAVPLAGALVILSVAAPGASAKEKLVTLYSPRIQSLPYVHDTHSVPLL
jgi:hypothetical protein